MLTKFASRTVSSAFLSGPCVDCQLGASHRWRSYWIDLVSVEVWRNVWIQQVKKHGIELFETVHCTASATDKSRIWCELRPWPHESRRRDTRQLTSLMARDRRQWWTTSVSFIRISVFATCVVRRRNHDCYRSGRGFKECSRQRAWYSDAAWRTLGSKCFCIVRWRVCPARCSACQMTTWQRAVVRWILMLAHECWTRGRWLLTLSTRGRHGKCGRSTVRQCVVEFTCRKLQFLSPTVWTRFKVLTGAFGVRPDLWMQTRDRGMRRSAAGSRFAVTSP